MSTVNTNEDLQHELTKLTSSHRELDQSISKLELSPGSSDIELHRLKKQKLALKDRISLIEQKMNQA